MMFIYISWFMYSFLERVYIHTDIHTYMAYSFERRLAAYIHAYIHTYIDTHTAYRFERRLVAAKNAVEEARHLFTHTHTHTHIHACVHTHLHTHTHGL